MIIQTKYLVLLLSINVCVQILNVYFCSFIKISTSLWIFYCTSKSSKYVYFWMSYGPFVNSKFRSKISMLKIYVLYMSL